MSHSNAVDRATILEDIAEDFKQVYFIYQLDTEQFIYLGAAFRLVWETDEASVRQHPGSLRDYLHPDDQKFVEEQFYKLKADQQPKSIEFRINTPSQITKWICMSAGFYRSPTITGNLMGGFFHEITKNKEYLHTTLNFNAKKNATLEVLSHDLATPFTNIQGMIDLMEHQVQEGNADVNELMAYIKRDAQRGSDLIRDFVGNEFLESSQVVLYKERFDVKAVIEEIMADYKRGESLVSKQFLFISPETPVYVEADQLKFMQVLNNLISNAIKFSQDDGKITITVEDRPTSTYFSVQDNGIGVPLDLQPFLFDKFTKARREGIKGEKSVGLGLNIIKNIVQLHQGRVWCQSLENSGTTFFIELPKASLT